MGPIHPQYFARMAALPYVQNNPLNSQTLSQNMFARLSLAKKPHLYIHHAQSLQAKIKEKKNSEKP